MQNMLIAWGNRVNAVTLSGGSWVSTMPLVNLKDRQLGVKARAADMGLMATKFLGSLPVNQAVRVLAIANHNLSLEARMRLRLNDDPSFPVAPVGTPELVGTPSGLLVALTHTIPSVDDTPPEGYFDSGWVDVWPAVYASTDLDWNADNWWDGRYLEEDIGGYTRTLVVLLPQVTRPLYLQWEFDDQENPDGFVEMGRLFLAPSWQPVRNANFGATLGWEDSTDVQPAISGAEFFDVKVPCRVAQFRFDNMTENEGLSSPFEIMRRMGVHEEVLFMWDPDDTIHATRRQFLGRLRQLSPLEFPDGFINGDQNTGDFRTSVPMEIKELVA